MAVCIVCSAFGDLTDAIMQEDYAALGDNIERLVCSSQLQLAEVNGKADI